MRNKKARDEHEINLFNSIQYLLLLASAARATYVVLDFIIIYWHI